VDLGFCGTPALARGTRRNRVTTRGEAPGSAHSFVGKIGSGERSLNVLEFCEYADALGADAAEIIGSVVKARG
jgi:hypothetical protein